MSGEPLIREYMTLQPQSIEGKESLDTARSLMTMFGIRHLPVTQDGIVVGMLSQREADIGLQLEIVEGVKRFLVIDACSEKPYIAYPETPLREVAAVMAREHLGSVIIMENAKLVGIFTTVDACRVLHDLIEGGLREEGLETIKKMRSAFGKRIL